MLVTSTASDAGACLQECDHVFVVTSLWNVAVGWAWHGAEEWALDWPCCVVVRVWAILRYRGGVAASRAC